MKKTQEGDTFQMKQFDYIKSTKQMVKAHDFINGYIFILLKEGEQYNFKENQPRYYSRRDEEEYLYLAKLYEELANNENL